MREARTAEAARSLVESNLSEIERTVRYVAGRNGLGIDEKDDFRSFVMVKFVESDYGILRKYRGESTLTTYLATVVQRLFLDYRVAQWGKFRSSAKAQRLGGPALLLERLLRREGFHLQDAIHILQIDFGIDICSEELHDLAQKLPQLGRPRIESNEDWERYHANETTETELDRRAAAESAVNVGSALRRALLRLSEEDRLVLRLRFVESFTVSRIARRLGLRANPLYKRIDRCLGKLRKDLEKQGLSRTQVADLWLFKTQFDLEKILPIEENIISVPSSQTG